MNRYDVVTFDMGYTLVHFYPSEEELYLDAFRSVGLQPHPDALRQAHDLAWREYYGDAACAIFEPSEERNRQIEEQVMRRTLAHLEIDDPGLAPRLVTAAKIIFQAPEVIRVYPEVEEVLQTLRKRGYPLAIISNWSWDLHDYVRLAGLMDYFDVIIASARAGCDKPHPEIFHQALRALNSPPQRAIHIGDSYEADVVGARGVGMDALWLDRSRCGGHPDCTAIRNLTEVLDIVLGRGQRD